MLINLFTFVLVVFAIWLNMAVVKLLLGIWLNDEKATLAAYAFSVGTLAGLRTPPSYDDTIVGSLAGAIIAYAGLWWVHFGRARWESRHR